MARLLGAFVGLFVIGLVIGGGLAVVTNPPAPVPPVAVASPTPASTPTVATVAPASATPMPPTPSAPAPPTTAPVTAAPITPAPATPTPATPTADVPTVAPATPTQVPATATPAPPTPATADPAAIPDFIDALGRAISRGTNAFLFDNLHSAVLDRYGDEQCRTYTRNTRSVGLNLDYVSAIGPEPWDWVLDDRTTVIPDAWTVTIHWQDPQANVDEQRDVHIAPAGGSWRWFTDCGDPLK